MVGWALLAAVARAVIIRVPDVFKAYSFYIDGTDRHAETDLLDDRW
jgi:hypothetical protein